MPDCRGRVRKAPPSFARALMPHLIVPTKRCDHRPGRTEANLAKHGIDFADIDEAFFAKARFGPAKKGRYFAIGELNGVIVVIFAALGSEAISIVSARPANRKERSLLP